MSLHEFEAIDRFFTQQTCSRDDVILSSGDDAAIIQVPKDKQLIVTTDTLFSGIHFFEDCHASDIAYKALAVNLSDIAAMGAEPAWATAVLSLPALQENWLKEFSHSFFELADHYNVQLIGGDLTHGPLSVTVQLLGLIEPGQALRRDGAKPGDFIYVSGDLGAAAFAVHMKKEGKSIPESDKHFFLQRLQRPIPRIKLGQALIGIASATIDISDGLAADLGHILKASQLGARIEVTQLPICSQLNKQVSIDQAMQFALSGGDDYELCFTVPGDKKTVLEEQLKTIDCSVCCVGRIEAGNELWLLDENGEVVELGKYGYEHF